MLILSMLPAASAFAQSAPAVTLVGSTIIAQPGTTVSYTATASNVSNPEYQFWVENPNGTWKDAQNYSTANTFQLKNVQSGNYLVAVEVMTQYQVQHGLWQDALTPLADGVFVNSSVTLSTSSATVAEGQNITVSAVATNIYDPLYQFWYETPSGQWEQSGNYSASGTYTFKASETGTYHMIGYAKSPLAVNDPEGALYSNTLTEAIQAAVSAVTVSGSNDIPAGNATTLTAMPMQDGVAVTSPSTVSWTVTSSNGTASGVAFSAPASLTTTVNIPANDPGTYLVTATVDGVKSAPFKVVAYGQASAVTETAASSAVVADGQDTDTITATVLDANGNLDASYSGTATIMISNASAVTLATGSSQKADVSGSTLTFTGGSASFNVVASKTPGETGTITLSGLTAHSGSAQSATISYSGVSIATAPQSATSITVAPASKTLSVNANAVPDTVNVTVDDQAGYPMLGGTYVLHASVSGGATFTGSATSETVYASGDPATTGLTVYGAQGITGTYVITVTGSGLTAGTGSISAVVTSVAADLTATDATPTFTEGSAAGTAVTLGATDASGDAVSLPGTVLPEVTITNASGVAVTGLTVAVSGTTISPVSGVYDLPAGTSGFVVADAAGNQGAGAYTVSIKDGETSQPLAATSVAVTELAASAGTFTLAPATNVLDASHLSTTLAVQVTDAYGNPVADSSVPVTISASADAGAVSLNGQAYSTSPTLTVDTNSQGLAQVTFTAEDYTATWTVSATIAAGAIGAGSSAKTQTAYISVQNHPAASYAFALKDTSGVYSGNTTYAQAGDTVAVTPALLQDGVDSNGNPVPGTVDGTDNVTVTVDHASGLSGLPASSAAGVTVTTDSATDTVTLKGTLSAVSTALSSTLTAAKAGEVTVAIVDSSTGAQGSASIDVVASTTVSELDFSGLSNNETLTANTAYPVTVTLADVGGNPIVATTSQTVTLSTSGVSAVDSAGATITQVVIPAGQSSVSFTVVTPASGTFTSGSVTASDSTDSVTGSVTGLSD